MANKSHVGPDGRSRHLEIDFRALAKPLSPELARTVSITRQAINEAPNGLPYYFPASFELKPKIVPAGLMPGPAGVDSNGTLFLDEEWWKAAKLYDRVVVMIHEIKHLLHHHISRLKPWGQEITQFASDVWVNESIKEEGLRLLDGCITQEFLEARGIKFPQPAVEMSVEQIAQLLLRNQEKLPRMEEVGITILIESENQGDKDGEGSGIRIVDWDEVASQCWQWAMTKGQGDLPAGAVLPVEPKPAKMDFRPTCWRWWASGDNPELTFARPTRRLSYLSHKYALPGQIWYGAEEAWVIDTSGSVVEKELPQFLGEAEHARRLHNIRVYLIIVDADVHSSGWIEPDQPLPEIRGGGGSDLRPAFDHLAALDYPPDRVIVLTDGWITWPDSQPVPNLLTVTSDKAPPYGEWVKMEID